MPWFERQTDLYIKYIYILDFMLARTSMETLNIIYCRYTRDLYGLQFYKLMQNRESQNGNKITSLQHSVSKFLTYETISRFILFSSTLVLWLTTIAVPSLNPNVIGLVFVVKNIGIFSVFLRVLLFHRYHSTYTLHFLVHLSIFKSFIFCIKSPI